MRVSQYVATALLVNSDNRRHEQARRPLVKQLFNAHRWLRTALRLLNSSNCIVVFLVSLLNRSLQHLLGTSVNSSSFTSLSLTGSGPSLRSQGCLLTLLSLRPISYQI